MTLFVWVLGLLLGCLLCSLACSLRLGIATEAVYTFSCIGVGLGMMIERRSLPTFSLLDSRQMNGRTIAVVALFAPRLYDFVWIYSYDYAYRNTAAASGLFCERGGSTLIACDSAPTGPQGQARERRSPPRIVVDAL